MLERLGYTLETGKQDVLLTGTERFLRGGGNRASLRIDLCSLNVSGNIIDCNTMWKASSQAFDKFMGLFRPEPPEIN